MDKKQIKKNIKDLEYRKYSQILNSVIIFTTTGILGFLGSFIFLEDKDKLFVGLTLSIILFIMGVVIYKQIDKKLKQISKELENI